jgi:hypothetical protein
MGKDLPRRETPNPHLGMSFPWMRAQIAIGEHMELRGVCGNGV